MKFEVFYTQKAKESLGSVRHLILNSWTEKEVDAFLKKAEVVIEKISNYPYLFRSTEIDENGRIAIITPQTSLIYEVVDSKIILHFFWDNRQDPLF